MLILTRRPGQNIKIGANIDVTIVSVRGNQVRVGIKAPRDIPVDREEIGERKAAELKSHAAGPSR